MKICTARVKALIDREMNDIWKNRMILSTMIFVPLIFMLTTVGTMIAMSRDPDPKLNEISQKPSVPKQLRGLPRKSVLMASIAEQYLYYFLMIPCMLPLVIATTSIIGEKEQKSLEPLLATPVSTEELFLGKSLAAILMPILITWCSYGLTSVIISFFVPHEVLLIFIRPAWILAMLLLCPLIGWLSVLTGMIISSRVNDYRVAQQIGGLIVLPIVGLSIFDLLGKLYFSVTQVIMMSLTILAVSIIVLLIAVELFDRETILTRWK